MICVIALFVFAVLGIFSAKYRSLAKEAFRCTFLKITLRPCDTQLDQKIKSKLVGRLLPKAPNLAKFIYKRFDMLSTLFTLLLFASMAYSAYSIFNLVTLGTCDPNGTCVITTVGGICIIELEKYAAITILAVFAVALAYILLKKSNGKGA